MRGIEALASVALLLGVWGTAAGDPYLLDLSGNNFSVTEAQVVGQELKVALLLSKVQDNPPFAVPGAIDWSTEYTLYVSGLMLTDPPGNPVKSYSGGSVQLWSENPPDAPWTPTTPVGAIPAYNAAEVPTKLTDGTALLIGSFTQFATLFFGGNTGSISATINWTGGSKLGDLAAQGITDNWHWNGWFNLTAPVPPGYQLLYGGKLEHEQAVGVEPATWGKIKNLLRAD